MFSFKYIHIQVHVYQNLHTNTCMYLQLTNKHLHINTYIQVLTYQNMATGFYKQELTYKILQTSTYIQELTYRILHMSTNNNKHALPNIKSFKQAPTYKDLHLRTYIKVLICT